MAKIKVNKLSKGSVKAFELLKEHGDLTIAEMKDLGLPNANSSHLLALRTRGLVEAETVVIVEMKPVKRKVMRYSLTGKELAEIDNPETE